MPAPRVAIIIPAYNAADYIEASVRSILRQSVGDFQLLVVNDGSKDSSSAIGHEYEAKYPQTFRVIDKENGNYGSCVNRGLKEATGKYVKVLDADDYFDTDVFEAFVHLLSEINADLLISDFDVDIKCINSFNILYVSCFCIYIDIVYSISFGIDSTIDKNVLNLGNS